MNLGKLLSGVFSRSKPTLPPVGERARELKRDLSSAGPAAQRARAAKAAIDCIVKEYSKSDLVKPAMLAKLMSKETKDPDRKAAILTMGLSACINGSVQTSSMLAGLALRMMGGAVVEERLAQKTITCLHRMQDRGLAASLSPNLAMARLTSKLKDQKTREQLSLTWLQEEAGSGTGNVAETVTSVLRDASRDRNFNDYARCVARTMEDFGHPQVGATIALNLKTLEIARGRSRFDRPRYWESEASCNSFVNEMNGRFAASTAPHSLEGRLERLRDLLDLALHQHAGSSEALACANELAKSGLDYLAIEARDGQCTIPDTADRISLKPSDYPAVYVLSIAAGAASSPANVALAGLAELKGGVVNTPRSAARLMRAVNDPSFNAVELCDLFYVVGKLADSPALTSALTVLHRYLNEKESDKAVDFAASNAALERLSKANDSEDPIYIVGSTLLAHCNSLERARGLFTHIEKIAIDNHTIGKVIEAQMYLAQGDLQKARACMLPEATSVAVKIG